MPCPQLQLTRAAPARRRYKTGEDEYQSLPEFNTLPPEQFEGVTSSDPSMCVTAVCTPARSTRPPQLTWRRHGGSVRVWRRYMNHSCAPTCWFEGSYLMTATRDVAPGEEITFDYCTSNDWPQDWACACGAPACRGRITGDEWRDTVRLRSLGCVPMQR